MNVTLLGQGYEPISNNAVGKYLIKFLADKDFNSFIAISAFTSLAAVTGLSKHITAAKKHLTITIITGVDQEVTSQEALEALLNLKIKAFVFYQPSFTIFHPKIYLFEGEARSELIVGSSNLTSQGLFTNVEASLLISVDNSVEADKKVIEQLKEYFKGIFDFTDPNLKKLSKEIIADLVKAKVVPTEAERKAAQDKAEKAERTKAENIILKIFPKRVLAKIPTEFKTIVSSQGITRKIDKVKRNPKSILTLGNLVWQKKNLPSSDAQQVTGRTKSRGIVGLNDAEFKLEGKKINRNTYFKDDVFGNLEWSLKERKNNSPLQETYATFYITIMGEDLGENSLRISHDLDRASDQDNIPTTIHWGKEMNSYLKQHSVIGKTLNLYSPTTGSNIYSIIIE